jgi:hypothetical protein
VRTFLAVLALAAWQGAPAFVPYDEAKPILAAHGRAVTAADWPAWVARRDAEIRARLARGDEDSLVYLWLYGTSFTAQPRATAAYLAGIGAGEKAEALLIARLHDFVAAVASPGANERLQFARTYLMGKGINPATARGRAKALEFLVGAHERVIAENQRLLRTAQAARQSAAAEGAPDAYATLYRDRGLSSDTRLTAAFAIDRALAAVAEAGLLAGGSVRRAAVVGPGLDVTDKAEGYDFYPQQTIQPFALVESLLRLELARTGELRIATFDLSPRVNTHLANAVRRAAAGAPYLLHLPRPVSDPRHDWQPELVAYWRTFGERIGRAAPPVSLPSTLAGVDVRGLAVSPIVGAAIAPHDLNAILQRQPLGERERFDLIVATNILVYYDAFDQALALTNVAAMLRPGGLFLTNYAVAPSTQLEALSSLTARVFFDKQGNGDTIYCYRRR